MKTRIKQSRRIEDMMFGKNKEARKKEFALSIVGLVINLQVFPGLGSVIGGRRNEGIGQIILSIIAVVLLINPKLLPIGILAMIVAWVWALMTGVKMVMEKAP